MGALNAITDANLATSGFAIRCTGVASVSRAHFIAQSRRTRP